MPDKKEKWKDVFGYEGVYRVSSYGIVFGYSKKWESGRWVTRVLPDRELRYFSDSNGYVVVQLRNRGKQKLCKVHRLVAVLFIPNPENKPQVNHKDGNKKNNRISNLEWATGAENMNHARDNKLLNPPKGVDHGCVKP